MKKIILIFTALIIFTSLVCYAEEADYNLPNSGFEEGTEKYGLFEGEGTKMTVVDTIANSGSNSLQINVTSTGHTSIWQTITPDRLCDRIKTSGYIYYDNDVDIYNSDFTLRLEVFDSNEQQYEITKTVTTPKEIVKGKWNYIESPYVKLPKNTKLIAISFINNMHGTVYIDDLKITGQFSQKQVLPPKREETALAVKNIGFETTEDWQGDFSLSNEAKNGEHSAQINGKITQLIDISAEELDKITKFGIFVKGTARITVESIDYYGYKSVIARSKTLNSPDEFAYLETDSGVILKRSQKLCITITGDALLDD